MAHIDALSKSFGVRVVEDNLFEWNLIIFQGRESIIKEIASKLESAEDMRCEMRKYNAV